MAARAISIEIGYSLTRVCEVDYKSKSHKVYKSFTIPTNEGMINDGVLTISPEYVESLKSALSANRIKAKQAVFTITSSRIASREVVIPFVKENRIMDVVNANATDYFPVDLSQYQLAYSILGTIGETKTAQQYKLLVMAVPSALLSGYYDLAKALKLEVAAMDYAGNSVFQVVKQECAQGTSLIVKIEERASLVMAVQDSVLTFTRNVSYGVDEVIDTVMNTLAWGDISSVEQAIRVLQRNECIAKEDASQTAQEAPDGVEGSADGAAVPAKSGKEKAMDEVRAAFMPLVGGIARVIDYYLSRNTNTPVGRIMITGLGADFKGLDELLSAEINMPVVVLREVAGWNLARDFKNESFGEYIACMGAAVAPLGFKKDTDKKGKEKSKGDSKSVNGAIIAYSLLVIGVVAGIALAAVSLIRYMGVQKTNMELKTEAGDLEDIIPIYNEYVAKKAEYTKVSAMYEATENRNEGLFEFLEELEENLPSSVNVISLSSNADGVSISMEVDTKEEAAATVQKMRTFHSLIPQMVTLAALREEEDQETGVITINFTVTASYWPVGYSPEEIAAEAGIEMPDEADTETTDDADTEVTDDAADTVDSGTAE